MSRFRFPKLSALIRGARDEREPLPDFIKTEPHAHMYRLIRRATDAEMDRRGVVD